MVKSIYPWFVYIGDLHRNQSVFICEWNEHLSLLSLYFMELALSLLIWLVCTFSVFSYLASKLMQICFKLEKNWRCHMLSVADSLKRQYLFIKLIFQRFANAFLLKALLCVRCRYQLPSQGQGNSIIHRRSGRPWEMHRAVTEQGSRSKPLLQWRGLAAANTRSCTNGPQQVSCLIFGFN